MISLKETGSAVDGSVLDVSMQGSLTDQEIREAKTLLSVFIESKAASSKRISIDVSGLDTVSSVVVAFLLSGLRAAKRNDCELYYKNLPEYLFNMARVGGVETILVGVG